MNNSSFTQKSNLTFPQVENVSCQNTDTNPIRAVKILANMQNNRCFYEADSYAVKQHEQAYSSWSFLNEKTLELNSITKFITWFDKILQFDWLRGVVFIPNSSISSAREWYFKITIATTIFLSVKSSKSDTFFF